MNLSIIRIAPYAGRVARPAIALLALLLSLPPLFAAETAPAKQSAAFREDFDTLAQWEPLTFPKIKAHSTYTLVREGDRSSLRAESRNSASGLVSRRTFNVYETPRLRWRWKVEQLPAGGDPREKEGDDYPIRVYVVFAYDPAQASLGDRLTYGAARLIYGEYPPHSTLNYVWAGRDVAERIIVSPYTEKARMIFLEKGRQRVGQWVEESVDILADYRAAFGKDPPATAGLAVMSDTDNAGGTAVGYIDFIEGYR